LFCKRCFILFFIANINVNADEYDFDMDAIEQKPYEYSGYLRMEDKVQRLNNATDQLQNHLYLDGLLNFSYQYQNLKFKTSVMATYDYINDKIAENQSLFYLRHHQSSYR